MAIVLSKHRLRPHPDTPVPAYDVGAKLQRVGSDVLMIEYVVVGPLDTLALPEPATPDRSDELWKHSCFEAFAGRPGEGYLEFNFAPSGEWAIYRFEAYRSGMQPAMDLKIPALFPERTTAQRFSLTVVVELSRLWAEGATHLGLSAVIEETDGTKSYWALRHPPGEPDFHHPDCFALELPAAKTA